MKQLRYLLVAAIFTLSAFSMVLYSSCSKNKCGSTTCQNGGSCVDSKCICPTGYSGTSCQTGWSDAAIGTYNCVRSNCHPAVGNDSTWQSSVTKASTNGGFTINISNFGKSGYTAIATIDSPLNGVSNVLISTATGTNGVQATGKYSSNTLTLDFTTASSSGVGGYTCHMVMTKI